MKLHLSLKKDAQISYKEEISEHAQTLQPTLGFQLHLCFGIFLSEDTTVFTACLSHGCCFS